MPAKCVHTKCFWALERSIQRGRNGGLKVEEAGAQALLTHGSQGAASVITATVPFGSVIVDLRKPVRCCVGNPCHLLLLLEIHTRTVAANLLTLSVSFVR